jgi:hypothetical protein
MATGGGGGSDGGGEDYLSEISDSNKAKIAGEPAKVMTSSARRRMVSVLLQDSPYVVLLL